MIIIWIFVILIGTLITVFGSLKLNDEWTKGDAQKQSHIIPDFMLVDFEVEAEFDKELKDKILTECKSKISRYSEESTPAFRAKGRHLFRSKVRQLNRPLSSLSKDDIFQS